MAIAFGAIGTKLVTGTTTAAIAYPASVAAGDALLVHRSMWDAVTRVIPTGYVDCGGNPGGTGSAADAHTSTVGVDAKEAVGGEAGTLATTSGGNTGIAATMTRYTKAASEAWFLPATSNGFNTVYCTAAKTTHAANWSTAGASSLMLAPGDMVVATVSIDTDAAMTITAPAITAPGITFGATTRRTSGAGSTIGTDGNVEVFDALVTAGSATAIPTLAFTSVTTTCGAVIFDRLRASVPRRLSTVSNPALAHSFLR